MTDKEKDVELAVQYAIERAESIGVDTSSLKPKSELPLVILFRAIDKCLEDSKKAKAGLRKYKVNPTNLGRYGAPRSTINENPVFREIVRYYEETQDSEFVTVKRSEYETMARELEMLRIYRENSIHLGLENQKLREANEKLTKERDIAQNSYAILVERQNAENSIDFNDLLKK